jgi:hypothetical protein
MEIGGLVSNLYNYLLVAHVLVAVLGLGSIVAVTIVATTARRVERGSTEALKWIAPLLRCSTFSLVAMMPTGFLLNLTVDGAFGATWWFRGSVLLLIATNVLQALARRAVRHGIANENNGDLRRVKRIAYGMGALIAVITALMEVKPF